jgi:hypothetical protein
MVVNQIIFVARLKCRSRFAILDHNRIDDAKEIQFRLFQQGCLLLQCGGFYYQPSFIRITVGRMDIKLHWPTLNSITFDRL